MRACQRELRRAVIKRSRLPCCRRMALGTRLRIGQNLMIGIRCACEIGTVTVNAIHRECRELVVLVAVFALQRLMRTRQREFCDAMRERRRFPGGRRMTGLTCRLKLCCNVAGIGCRLKLSLVTAIASRRRILEHSILVARRARH
jgi:hypothetical protein